MNRNNRLSNWFSLWYSFGSPFPGRLFPGLLRCLVVVVVATAHTSAQQTDDESALPFISTDQVAVRVQGSQKIKTLSGVIEDMSGPTVVLRRDGNTIDVFTLREVVSVKFQKSAEFNDGLRKLRRRDWQGALSALQSAATIEPRKWVFREIQASTAQALRGLGQLQKCLETVEKIVKDDPDSRHVVELPLVWDERLPDEHRISLAVSELKSNSPVRQLTAASALLQDPEHQAAAVAALQSLRKSSRGVLQELAETQLWRVRLLHPDELRESEVSLWIQRVRHLDRRTRSGPEFLIGRALLTLHDYDKAATSLLWMPLLEPLDPPTTAASLVDAVSALELSGRTAEAAQLRLELAEIE